MGRKISSLTSWCVHRQTSKSGVARLLRVASDTLRSFPAGDEDEEDECADCDEVEAAACALPDDDEVEEEEDVFFLAVAAVAVASILVARAQFIAECSGL